MSGENWLFNVYSQSKVKIVWSVPYIKTYIKVRIPMIHLFTQLLLRTTMAVDMIKCSRFIYKERNSINHIDVGMDVLLVY